MIIASMVVFTVLYAVLGVIWYRLIHRYAIEGVPSTVRDESPEAAGDETDRPLSFAY
jgi:cytochrome d ubiquinol oxidase subunit I